MSMTEDHVLGQYELLERIGRGGMAEVYHAKELTASDREVAIKVIQGELTPNPLLSQRFLREARTLSRLSHPHILSPIDWGEEDGTFYLVMPWVRDGTLSQFLKARGGALSIQEALPLFGQLCQAVQYAHDSGIIHRDIKPQNVLIERGGYVLLADFGIALDFNDTRLTLTGGIPGSAAYMAPEQARGQATARSDVYSLGIVLYQMLTGAVPFSGVSPLEVLLKQCQAPVPDPRQFQPYLPAEAVRVLYRALEKDPARRYESALAFWCAVQQLGNLPAASFAPSFYSDTDPMSFGDERQGWSAWPESRMTLPFSQPVPAQRPARLFWHRKGLAGGVIAGATLLFLALLLSAHLGLGTPAGLSLHAASSTKASKVAGPTATPVAPPRNAAPVEPTPTPPAAGAGQSQPGSAGNDDGQDGQGGSPGHDKGHGHGGKHGKGGDKE